MDLAVDAFAPLFGVSSRPSSTLNLRASGVGLALEQIRPNELCKIVEVQQYSRFVYASPHQ